MNQIAGLKDLHQLAQLDAEELTREITRVSHEYAVICAKRASGELKQTHLIRIHRRYIARLKTFRRLLEIAA